MLRGPQAKLRPLTVTDDAVFVQVQETLYGPFAAKMVATFKHYLMRKGIIANSQWIYTRSHTLARALSLSRIHARTRRCSACNPVTGGHVSDVAHDRYIVLGIMIEDPSLTEEEVSVLLAVARC